MSKGNCRANGISERESNNQPDCKDDQDISHTSTEFLVSVGPGRVPSGLLLKHRQLVAREGGTGKFEASERLQSACTPCKRSSLSASARNFFSRRKCSSRGSGDRHIPAQRWCCRAIARYSIAVTMMSSHASSVHPAQAETNGVGRSNGSQLR
jgi:hypothetical protein